MLRNLRIRPLRKGSRAGERGYILLTLLLFVALLVIAAAAIVPTIEFQVKRDREEEMIHRGVQYSRAIRRFVKKFGRYPIRLEDLENTNNVRCLRRRYKDPINGQDFRLLHMGEVPMPSGVGSALPNPVAVGANGAMPGAAGQPGGIATGLSGPSGPGTQATSGEDLAPAGGNAAASNQPTQTFGGAPIIGVASKSKDESIREFNKKNHYKDWYFIYDPTLDRAGLVNTPFQPPLQPASPGTPTGQPGTPGGTPAPGQPVPPSQPPPQ